MSHYIEVETGLDEIKAVLIQQGYHVVDMNQRVFPVNAVIYTAPNMPEFKGQAAKTGQDTVLYNANGQSPQEVAVHIGEILS